MINLNQQYYTTSANYPQIIKGVIQRMRIYLTELLYADDPDIDEDGISPRVLIADIGSSTDEAIRRASQDFGPNQEFPFTAYGIGEWEIFQDRKNTSGALGLFYSDALASFVQAVPIKQELLVISFASNPDDYERIQKILINLSSTYISTTAEIEINGTTYNYPVRIVSNPTKGQYAHGFVEYLRMNGIYDVVHNFELYFHDLILDTDTTPIDEMTSNVKEVDASNDNMSQLQDTASHLRTDLPTITTTDPEEAEEDVPVGNSIILTFNVTMDESSVNSSIEIDPYFEYKPIWDDDSKVLILDPLYDLSSGTLYTITIPEDSAKAFYVFDYLDEFELTFTTED